METYSTRKTLHMSHGKLLRLFFVSMHSSTEEISGLTIEGENDVGNSPLLDTNVDPLSTGCRILVVSHWMRLFQSFNSFLGTWVYVAFGLSDFVIPRGITKIMPRGQNLL